MTFYQSLFSHLKNEFPEANFYGQSFPENFKTKLVTKLRPLPTQRVDTEDLRITQRFQIQLRIQKGASDEGQQELDKLVRFFNPQFQEERAITLGVHTIHYRSSGAAVPIGDQNLDGSFIWEIIAELHYSNNAITGQLN